jgi:DNA-binding CsgD family transcriptional regulator
MKRAGSASDWNGQLPAVLFAENGSLAFTNSCAMADLKLRAHFTVDEGHLLPEDNIVTRKVNQELTKAIRASRSERVEPCVVMLPLVDQLPMILMFAPLRSAERARGALLFVFDPSATHRLTADLVRLLFGLSQTEAALMVALCSGKSLDDAACERGVSTHNTHSQLKSILQKTGTSRQTELMSLVLANPAHFLSTTARGVKRRSLRRKKSESRLPNPV